MKKFIFGFISMIAATMFVACGSASTTETTDETVDSVKVVADDVVEVDTLAVETVAEVDTVVAE